MDTSNRFQPTLHGKEFERLCGKYGIRDFQLIHMISQGVDSLTETRPYAVVLNFNYASLAQFYDQILTKAMKEREAGELMEMRIDAPPKGFTADTIRLPCVPMGLDSSGAATKKYDTNIPPKARRTCGKGAPEDRPEYSCNGHALVGHQWSKPRLPTVRTHMICACILRVPADLLGEELVNGAADFKSFYCQFHNAVKELVHCVILLVGEDKVLHFLTSRVMQFGGSFGPAVGQGIMECLCEIARQRFDTEDRCRVLALAASHAGMKGWLEGREQLALDMMLDDYARIADKDTFFANQDMVKWKAARWLKYTDCSGSR